MRYLFKAIRPLILLLIFFIGIQNIVSQTVPELMYYTFDSPGNQKNYASAPVGDNPATLGTLTIGNTGQFGTALIGDGGAVQNGAINTAWATNLPSTGWTISFWINNYPVGGIPEYLFGDENAADFRCFSNGMAGDGIVLRGGGLTDVLLPGILPGPTVVHFVYTGTEIKAYVNGVLSTTVAQPTINITGIGPFMVGEHTTSGMTGGIPNGSLFDEFRMYNRVLSGAEVASSWNIPLMLDITTNSATAITKIGATFNGTINPKGAAMAVFFEYGTTSAYGTTVAAVPDTVDASVDTPVSAVIAGLTPNTIYHYRGLGGPAGVIEGNDIVFETLPDPTIVGPTPICIEEENNVYTTEAGKTNYSWNVPPAGTIKAGGGVNDNTVTITWNTPGTHNLTLNYDNSSSVPAASPTIYQVTVYTPPVATIVSKTLLTESFENAGTLPAGWVIESIATNNTLTFVSGFKSSIGL